MGDTSTKLMSHTTPQLVRASWSLVLIAGLKIQRVTTVKEIQSWFGSLTLKSHVASCDYENKRIKGGDKGKGNTKVVKEIRE